jgi:hypothetical protein
MRLACGRLPACTTVVDRSNSKWVTSTDHAMTEILLSQSTLNTSLSFGTSMQACYKKSVVCSCGKS